MKQSAQTVVGKDKIDMLIKENIDLIDRLTAAEMSVKDYRAKNTMLREALEKITMAVLSVHQGSDEFILKTAQRALGGGEFAPRYPWHPTEDDYKTGGAD